MKSFPSGLFDTFMQASKHAGLKKTIKKKMDVIKSIDKYLGLYVV